MSCLRWSGGQIRCQRPGGCLRCLLNSMQKPCQWFGFGMDSYVTCHILITKGVMPREIAGVNVRVGVPICMRGANLRARKSLSQCNTWRQWQCSQVARNVGESSESVGQFTRCVVKDAAIDSNGKSSLESRRRHERSVVPRRHDSCRSDTVFVADVLNSGIPVALWLSR